MISASFLVFSSFSISEYISKINVVSIKRKQLHRSSEKIESISSISVIMQRKMKLYPCYKLDTPEKPVKLWYVLNHLSALLSESTYHNCNNLSSSGSSRQMCKDLSTIFHSLLSQRCSEGWWLASMASAITDLEGCSAPEQNFQARSLELPVTLVNWQKSWEAAKTSF